MPLSEARTPTFSGTTSGEWSRPSLSEYISAFATESDQDVSQVSDLSQESRNNIAQRTLVGDPDADTEDDLIAFPVVSTENSLHESALEAAISRAPQSDLPSDTVDSIQSRARGLLEEEFDRDLEESRNSDMDTISPPAATTRLEEIDLDAPGPWTISGVALAEDEITRDPEKGMLLWPADTLQEAAPSLEGQPLTRNHPEAAGGGVDYPPDVEDTIGRVNSSEYIDGVGVVYEATLSDESVARKVRDQVLDVSPDIGYTAEGTDPETGAWVASDAMFIQLGIVSKGAGPGNSAQLGPSRELASMSAADLTDLLSEADEARLQGLDEYDDPAEAPNPNVGDAVVWRSDAGGDREPSDRRYGVVVDGLQDGPDDSVLVAVYQPDADYEEWEARNEQNSMSVDSLIPIGSDGVGSLPAISQVRNADREPEEPPEPSSEVESVDTDGDGDGDGDGDEADDTESADADGDPDNGGEDPPEGDDARHDTTGQSTPVGDGESASETPPASDSDTEDDTTTDMSAQETAQNEPADAEAEAQADADADAEVQDTTTTQEQTQNTTEEPEQTETSEQTQDQDRLKARLADVHERANELAEEKARLEDENARLQKQVEGAGKAYANALFDEDDPVTPDEALEMMSVEQLRQKYEARDDVSLVEDDTEPDVQGGDTSPSDGATASLSDDQTEEIQRLEESLQEAERLDMSGAARHYRSKLEDLRNGGAE